MISYRVESLRVALSEVKELVGVHHQEVEDGKWKINPDWNRMVRANEDGSYLFIAVRDDERLVGYSADWITDNLHYKGRKSAVNDGVYMAPDYRHFGLTEALLMKVKEELRVLGVDSHSVTLKVKNPCRTLMEQLGYVNQELIWFTRL